MTAALVAPSRLPDLLGTSPADLLPEGDRHDSTQAEARERADRLRAGILRYAEMRQDIADAFACRDWIALGYQSWAAYVEGEFGEQLAQLGRAERQQAVGDLRGQGMSVRQIAGATGASYGTVRNDIAEVSKTAQLPETVTGSDGKQHPASRPTPPIETPGWAGAVTAPPADPGTTPEPERHLHAVPDPALEAQLAADSARRAAIRNLTSVLTFLNPLAITPAELAASEYGPVLDEFEQEDLDRAAETMTAIAAMKRGM